MQNQQLSGSFLVSRRFSLKVIDLVERVDVFASRQVAAAQAALERGESGAAERLEAAEEELERALEAVLDAECAGGGGFGG